MADPQDTLRLLGDPTRMRVLRAILTARKNVSQIVSELGLSQPQVSYHLRVLREARLATEEREGRWVWYEANRDTPDPRVRELLDLVAGWSGGQGRAGRGGAPRAPRRLRPVRAPEAAEVDEVEAVVVRPPRPAPDMDDFLL